MHSVYPWEVKKHDEPVAEKLCVVNDRFRKRLRLVPSNRKVNGTTALSLRGRPETPARENKTSVAAYFDTSTREE